MRYLTSLIEPYTLRGRIALQMA